MLKGIKKITPLLTEERAILLTQAKAKKIDTYTSSFRAGVGISTALCRVVSADGNSRPTARLN